MDKQLAVRLHSVIMVATASVDDKTASIAPKLFPRLQQNSALVTAGNRINWNGTLKRAAVDLWDTPENNPDNAPTLWEDTQYRSGYRIIPEPFTQSLINHPGHSSLLNLTVMHQMWKQIGLD